MVFNRLATAWLAVFVCLFWEENLTAQCLPPTSIWLSNPASANTLPLNWSPGSPGTFYQIRYWDYIAPGDKSVLEPFVAAPFQLTGLRKNAWYAVQLRSYCNGVYSAWGPTFNFQTAGSSENCSTPTGVSVEPGAGQLRVTWTSPGLHTIRYRLGTNGDWLIPTGALATASQPLVIAGLPVGTYQVEIKRTCTEASGNFMRFVRTVTTAFVCTTPSAPTVIPDVETAVVQLPAMIGISAYNVQLRSNYSDPWQSVGLNIPASAYTLPLTLSPSTNYLLRIQAVCNGGTSDFSPTVHFTTLDVPSCLLQKNYGKNLSESEIAQINERYNQPSPFTLASMIGINDGGLIFRSFQNETVHPIAALTRDLRIFHTMDEDFDGSLGTYDQNIKPKDTQPEGAPANMGHNQGFYKLYRQIHGFDQITAATEILQYSPQSWKDKNFRENDWSAAGPAGIRNSFSNYTATFIDHFAPPSADPLDVLATQFQVGNEWWDYPVASDYQQMLQGAKDAFALKYGPKSSGNWKMKLVAGAFQAFRSSNCVSALRNVSNCGAALERHDFIGDYLNVTDCSLLRDLDAVDCHPYSYLPGTTHWVHPEHPKSETWQIRNLAAWRDANRNPTTGVLTDTRLWSTEFGFDSNPVTGVGEKTQAAYLLRGLMLHSRFHFEKVYFYNAYDHLRKSDTYYNGLYNSSGFWQMGTSPHNPAWPSPLPADGAAPKPAWHAMLDLKNRLGDHVFYKALKEDSTAFVYLLARPDGSDPYLVFWSPQATDDNNIDSDMACNLPLNWSGILPNAFAIEYPGAQSFSLSDESGSIFDAFTQTGCNQANIHTIRRLPAFVRLSPCDACINVVNPGSLLAPTPASGNTPFDPGLIASLSPADGGMGGVIQYQWQISTDNQHFTDIPGALSPEYNPPSLLQTTYLRRGARRSSCTEYVFTPSILLTVNSLCPQIQSFLRHEHAAQGCNPAGDYYYELKVDHITAVERIVLENLPPGGINITGCMLNGVALNLTSFNANLQYGGFNRLDWVLKPANGMEQTLRLQYCWAGQYPEPVDLSTAMPLCSGVSTFCADAGNKGETRREAGFSVEEDLAPDLNLLPNPGTDQVTLQYFGARQASVHLRVYTATGQWMTETELPGVESGSQWVLDTSSWPPGLYFILFESEAGRLRQNWIKL